MLKTVIFSLEDWRLLLENGRISKSPKKHVLQCWNIFFFFKLQNLQFFVINKLDSGPDLMIIYPKKTQILIKIRRTIFTCLEVLWQSLQGSLPRPLPLKRMVKNWFSPLFEGSRCKELIYLVIFTCFELIAEYQPVSHHKKSVQPFASFRIAPVCCAFFVYSWAGFRGRITLMRIRIQLFTLLRIWIQLFTSMRIRTWILLLIKVMRNCNHWNTDPPGLHFEHPRLHF